MRRFSIAALIVVILLGVFYVMFHARHKPQPSITGIGVMLTVRNSALEIMDVLPGSPAAKAGLHRGLIIQQIDGIDIVGKSLLECVAMTRGQVGSKVQFQVIDSAKSETNIMAFTREKVTLPSEAGVLPPKAGDQPPTR
jgi:C-terminal processing protease CtpA/Prc